MNVFVTDGGPELATSLLRAALAMVVAWCVLRGAMRALRIDSPRAARWAGWAVLAQGWMIAPLVIAIPWGTAPASPTPAEASAESTESSDGRSLADVMSHRAVPAVRVASASADAAADASAHRTSIGGDASHFGRDWRPLLLGVWACGVLGGGVLFLARYARFVRSGRNDATELATDDPDDAAAADEWLALQRDAGVRRPIPLRWSRSTGPALCLGLRGYELAAPRDFWLACSPAERTAILRHELSHWRRGDVWKAWLAYGLALPQWFNPIAWFAVATIRQAGEWLSDQDAADTGPHREDFLAALLRLAELQTRSDVAGGLCAHAHPLVVRVRRLLSPRTSATHKESTMKKTAFFVLVATLALAPAVRFQLVARAADAPASVQAVKERMEKLEQRVRDVRDGVAALKTRGEQLKEAVGEKAKQVKSLADNPASLSEDLKRRVGLFESGEEAKQLEALQDVEKLASRDEAILACGFAAKDSPHDAVRRRALAAAVSLGEDGYPALAIAYEALKSGDRAALAKELAKRNSADNVLFFALMMKDADADLRKTLLDLELPASQRLLFLTAIAESQMSDEFYDHLVATGVKLDGEPGLILLFALAAKGPEKQAAAAVEAAVKRKEDAWPVIAAAYKQSNKTTRAAVVRAAKQLGGEAGDFVLKAALADPDAELRAAAEEASK